MLSCIHVIITVIHLTQYSYNINYRQLTLRVEIRWRQRLYFGWILFIVFVGCLKVTKDKSSKSRVQTPDAGLIIAITAAPRREGRNPRLSITAAPRREGRNPHLSITKAPRRKAQNPRLSYNCPRYWVNYCPRNEEVNPPLWSVFRGHVHP